MTELLPVVKEDEEPSIRRHRDLRVARSKSMYGANPNTHFGPKGCILKNNENVITICDPASQKLVWDIPPLNVLVIRKLPDDTITKSFIELIHFLIEEKNMMVHIEKKSFEDADKWGNNKFKDLSRKLLTFEYGKDDMSNKIDLIVTLGGDGTLLYASSLFQLSVPPIMSFHLGSLGFLSSFDFDQYRQAITTVLGGNVGLCLRTRLRCTICHKDASLLPNCKLGGQVQALAMNEVVVDRGPSAYLCYLDLYIDRNYVTSVQGDGLIISTPTGSTAYAAAAGASMVHPSVPAIVIVPICAHSLSFRPIVIPAGVEIMLAVNEEARSPAWMSFDGRSRTKLVKGDVLRISTSSYPIPSVSATDPMQDWFNSLAGCLHWNVRKPQKSLSVTDGDLAAHASNGTPRIHETLPDQ